METDQTSSGTSQPSLTYDVMIIGAGPVGLATAIGLRKRGIENIILLDQTRAFRKVGQGLDLLPNGLKSLKYIDIQAYENIVASGQKFHSESPSKSQAGTHSNPSSQAWTTRNVKGDVIRSVALAYDEYLHKYGEGRVSLSWHELQTQLRRLIPPEQIKINHRCIHVVPESDWIRADFVSNREIQVNPYAHWQEQQPELNTSKYEEQVDSVGEITSIRSKLLIAADGINSTVRQIVYSNSPYKQYQTPEYTGWAAISSGGMNAIPEMLAKQLNEQFLHHSRVVTIINDQVVEDSSFQDCPRIILFSPQPNQIIYLIHAALSLELLVDKSGEALIQLALEELRKADFPESIQQVVALSSPAQVTQRPYYLHRASVPTEPQPKWNLGRVVLVGDAAHGMPPFMAQGVNQGLEDAAALSTLVATLHQRNHWDNLEAIAGTLRKYEDLRRPLMNRVQQATLTRLPLSEEKQWEEYCQEIYGRNIDAIMLALSQSDK